MSLMKYGEANRGFHGYDLLGHYQIASMTDTGAVLEWNAATGAFDPAHHAAKVTLSWTGMTSYTVEDGPDAGTVRITGGVLTGISYADGAGAALLDVSGLGLRLPAFMTLLARGDSFGSWAMVTRAAAVVQGSSGGDQIDTTTANDNVAGLGGDDFIQDRGGADVYAGGLGFDTLSYEGWNFTPWAMLEGVTVDQLLGTAKGPDGLTDTISGFEDVVGTLLADILRGNASANQFEGGAGADTIDGRGGQDLVSYARDAEWGGTDGIRVDLGANTIRDGFGYVDRVRNVEKVIGTGQRDTFQDSSADNWFDGGAGNDTLKFTGGNDYARGGAGVDTFLFTGAFADDVIEDFRRADGDRIRFADVTAFNQITLLNILTDQGPAALAMVGLNSVTLLGVSVSELAPSDFGF
ncbi:calcium-binding protein [Stagnihabitans tardus]|uniref:Calcium-binding protein n=1 Tax=Stagnihabitans tardus TaxID=2699202 RepID=A0AAE4YDN1_9RHOB|nr:calcium-binding protein [Stagnihabitans tardus]NBZ89747.1 hypothetical protein [Stagnihabitans tardus]